MKKLQSFIIFEVIMILSFVCVPAIAEEKYDPMSEISLGELLNMEIITAGKKAEKVSEIPASVVIVTRKDIERYGYISLVEILENVPGLYVSDDLAYHTNVFGVRGFWTYESKNIIILVNGVKQTAPQMNNYVMSDVRVPVEAIDRIEVVRGPMSVMYGGGAFFGVINIITNNVSNLEHGSIASVSYGSENTKKFFARLAGVEDKFTYVMNVGLYDTDGPDEQLSKMTSLDSSQSPLAGVPQNTGGRLEENNKYLNFSGKYKDFYTNFSYNENESEEYFFFPSATDGYLARRQLMTFSSGYQKEISDTIKIDGKLTYATHNSHRFADYFHENYNGTEIIEGQSYEAELNLFADPLPELNIMFGLNYRSDHIDHMLHHPELGLNSFSWKLINDDNVNTTAIFTQVNYDLLDNLKIVAGLRGEQVEKYEVGWSQGPSENLEYTEIKGKYEQGDIEIIPRFAAIYSLNENNIFKLLYGKAINIPSFFQNSQQVQSGNENLEPEYIETFELNYIVSFPPKITTNLSIFRNTLDKLITRVHYFDDQGTYHSFSSNAGEMVTNGIEISTLFSMFQHFRLELSGTYQKTENQMEGFKDIDVAYSPNLLAYAKASYAVNMGKIGNGIFSMTVNYVDEMEPYWDNSPQDTDDPNSPVKGRVGEKVDSYFLLGCNMRLDNLFGKRGLYLNIRGSNLFDKDVMYPAGTNNAWADKGTIGPGRRFLANIGWKF
ncbi:TonB-dependent receptor [Candidatus Halobeggiatoa sp. HSG11]|nr:TonB-dependent receptor [Candidatus Halobeggiatoa sp. HSG11]